MEIEKADKAKPDEKRIFGFTPNVFYLGVTSFLTDISSEMTFTILPLFLANVLGVRAPVIGLIEGIADSTATILRIFSGYISDRLGQRKSLTILGYGLSACSKPLLFFANAWGLVLAVRFSDRVGKGIRTAPRDALIADSAPATERGKSFGFHRAADSAGAVLGLALSALIIYLMQAGTLELTREAFQTMILVGIIPGFLAVLLIIFFVREIAAPRFEHVLPPSLTLKGFDKQYKLFLLIIVLFTLGNSSDAFLILRAQNLGLSVLQISIMLVAFNIIYTAISYPAGVLSDRFGRKHLIIIGWSIYAVIYLGFGMASESWQVWLLFVLYGIYYGSVEGVAKAFVADVVPSAQRGTAYGVYAAAVGISALPASLIAGLLWENISPAAPFYFGAGLAGVAMLLLLVFIKK